MRCLGHVYGTDCKKVIRYFPKGSSWDKYQLCYKCSKNDFTIQYRKGIDIHILQKVTIEL